MRAGEMRPQHEDEVTREIRHGLLWALGVRLAEEEGEKAWTRGGRWAGKARPGLRGPDALPIRKEEEDIRRAAA